MMRSLVVEPLPDAAAAASWTTAEERAAAAAFGSEQRLREYLGWRAVVRRRLGRATAIGYDAVGAPVVENRPGVRIAVSHCRGHVVVGFADGPCGVDIERRDRNFGRIAARYLTEAERALSDDEAWLGVAWCAKEALYKAAGRRELDLRGDLRLLRADLRSGAAGFSAGRSVEGEAGAFEPGDAAAGPAATTDGADVSDAPLVRGASGAVVAGADVLRTGASGPEGIGDGVSAGPEPPACLLPLTGCGRIEGRIGDGGPVRLVAWWNEEMILVSTV